MRTSGVWNTTLILRLLIVFGIFFSPPYTSYVNANSDEFAPSAATAGQAAVDEKIARKRSGDIIAEGIPQNIADAIAEISEDATDIGLKQKDPPLWPLFRQNELIGWAFDSIDLTNIPGFAGTPIDLLVVIDTEGNYVGVKVLHQSEPEFSSGASSSSKLKVFTDQYKGLSLRKNIKVRIRSDEGEEGGSNTFIDGITMATASVVVLNDTVILSALKVASNVLDGFSYREKGKVRHEQFKEKSWDQLLELGWVSNKRIVNKDIDVLFTDTSVDNPSSEPDALFTDLYFASLNVPTIGRNLLGAEVYKQLMTEELKPGDQAILVASNGSFSTRGEKFVRGSVPDRLGVFQNGLPLEIRDLMLYRLNARNTPHLPEFEDFTVFKIKASSLFDPSLPWSLNLTVKRSKIFQSKSFTRPLSFTYALPESFFIIPEDPEHRDAPWVQIWKARTLDVTILFVSLIVLSLIFIFQDRLVKYSSRLRWVRWLFLSYTLGFIGWYAQGQLSVINIFPIVRSFWEGFTVDMYLIDPITFVLWIYVFVSLFLWGRGLFCGWLCPFGALQEMIAWIGQKLHIRQWKISDERHRQFWILKYLILVALVGVSLFSTDLAISMSEVEPFKTAITETFVRQWPFILYTIIILGLGLFIHKFYCRYICPLGAGLAVLGWFHRFEWLERRKECGSPCGFCATSKVCGIKAIEPTGKINYNECIQCLNCVAVLKSKHRCVVSMLENKKLKKGLSISTAFK
jgi:NosR/NirI family transcriptional regulator, nitrous oxide reductase regulator